MTVACVILVALCLGGHVALFYYLIQRHKRLQAEVRAGRLKVREPQSIAFQLIKKDMERKKKQNEK